MELDFFLEVQSEKQGTPVGVLSFLSLPPRRFKRNHFFSGSEEPVHCMQVEFDYDGICIAPDSKKKMLTADAGNVRRDLTTEKALLDSLDPLPLKKLTKVYFWIDREDARAGWKTCASEKEWLRFMDQTVPALEEQGWQIRMDQSFGISVQSPDRWYVDLSETSGGTT